MRKRGPEKSEKRKEECRKHEWSEEVENNELMFDQESSFVNRVEEFETQATRRANETVHAPERYIVWWRKSWWIRISDRPALQTAKGRQRTWRAATRALEETDAEKWKEREKERVMRK